METINYHNKLRPVLYGDFVSQKIILADFVIQQNIISLVPERHIIQDDFNLNNHYYGYLFKY